MTHTKDKEMINANKAVIVTFPGHMDSFKLSNTGTANIYIPFPVKQMHVKGIDLNFDSDFRVLYFTSHLVDNGPLGSGFGGIICDNSTTTKNVSYIFKEPRDINGTYSFTYNLLDTISFFFTNGFIPGSGPDSAVNTGATSGAPFGRVLFMLEFIGYV